MSTRYCCIEGCPKVIESTGEKIPLYRFPKESSNVYSEWKELAGRQIREGKLTLKRLYICALHFDEDSFQKDGIAILKDGEQVIVPRTIQRLKKGAIPTIFPVSPEIGTDCKNTVKVPEHEISLTSSPSCDEWNSLLSGVVPHPWAGFKTSQGLLFLIDRGVVDESCKSCLIKLDNLVEIRAMGRIAKYPEIEKVRHFEDVCELLHKVNVSRLCKGQEERYDCNTVLFEPNNHSQVSFCSPCLKHRRLRRDRDKKRELCNLQRKKISRSYLSLKQKYLQSLEKIESLEKKLNTMMGKVDEEIKTEWDPEIKVEWEP